MRLMLGKVGNPSLLVDVDGSIDRNAFTFNVINGGWDGTFTNGHVTIHYGYTYGDETLLDKIEILCDNQDRLRGEYEDVFNNFDNLEYAGPTPILKSLPADWDDDIPF